MCKIYEGYVNDECDVPSLREFSRNTKASFVSITIKSSESEYISEY